MSTNGSTEIRLLDEELKKIDTEIARLLHRREEVLDKLKKIRDSITNIIDKPPSFTKLNDGGSGHYPTLPETEPRPHLQAVAE